MPGGSRPNLGRTGRKAAQSDSIPALVRKSPAVPPGGPWRPWDVVHGGWTVPWRPSRCGTPYDVSNRAPRVARVPAAPPPGTREGGTDRSLSRLGGGAFLTRGRRVPAASGGCHLRV